MRVKLLRFKTKDDEIENRFNPLVNEKGELTLGKALIREGKIMVPITFKPFDPELESELILIDNLETENKTIKIKTVYNNEFQFLEL